MKKLVLAFLIITCALSCSSDVKETKKTDILKKPKIPTELDGVSFEQIKFIHQYQNIYRWNNGIIFGTDRGFHYNELAEAINIPVSKAKSIDSYYHYEMNKFLTKKIRLIFKNHMNFEPDYYNPIQSTAYCGINTLHGNIVVYGQKNTDDFKAEATKIAKELLTEIPDWITGYKLNFTRYKDPNLETKGQVDIGFLWVRGQDIQVMKSSKGLYGYERPEKCIYWHNTEWNNQKLIPYPAL